MILWRKVLSVSLRLKLAIIMLLLALLVVGLAGFAIYQHGQATPPTESILIEQLINERLEGVATTLEHLGEAALQLANNPDNLDNFSVLNNRPTDTQAISSLAATFRQLLNSEATIREVRFVQLDGTVLVSVPDQRQGTSDKNELYYLTLRNNLPKQRSTDVFISKLSDEAPPSQDFVAIPVVGSEAVGFVVVEVDITGAAEPTGLSLYRNLRRLTTNVGQVDFYLINVDYRILAPGQEITKPENATIQLARQLRTQAGQSSFQYISPVTGKPALGIARTVPQTQFILVSEIPYSAIEASREGTRFALPMFALMILGLALCGLVFLILDLLIVRPVETLSNSARELVNGRALLPLPTLNRTDELGELYGNFGTLASTLREDSLSLNEQVMQRTMGVEATRQIGQMFASIRNLENLLQQVPVLIRQRFQDINHIQVYLLNATGDSAILRISTGTLGTSRLGQGKQMPVERANIIGKVILSGEPLVVMDIDAESLVLRAFLPEMRSQLVLPLVVSGQVSGALDLQSARVEAFSEADIRFYAAIADQLAIAIDNAEVFEHSQKRLLEIEALNQQLIGEAWQKHLGARANPVPAASSLSANSAHSSIEQWSKLQQQAAISGDIAEHVGPDVVTFAVPVSLRGQVLGAVEWDVPRTTYNDNSRQLARELATRLAISADNARLFEQAQRLAQRERLVNEISSKLTQQSDVADILRVAVREVGQALRVPHTAIRLATNTATEPDEVEETGN